MKNNLNSNYSYQIEDMKCNIYDKLLMISQFILLWLFPVESALEPHLIRHTHLFRKLNLLYWSREVIKGRRLNPKKGRGVNLTLPLALKIFSKNLFSRDAKALLFLRLLGSSLVRFFRKFSLKFNKFFRRYEDFLFQF